MKKLFQLLSLVLFTQTATADVSFFNKSTRNNMEVTFQYCYYTEDNPDNEKCLEAETLTLKKTSYLTIQPPSFPENTNWGPFIFVRSAIEKNTYGRTIAKGEYKNCFDAIIPFSQNSTAIELDDVNLSPIIVCRTSDY